MAIGELLSVALELNTGAWDQGATRAAASTARLFAALDTQNQRAQRGFAATIEAINMADRAAQIAAARMEAANLRAQARAIQPQFEAAAAAGQMAQARALAVQLNTIATAAATNRARMVGLINDQAAAGQAKRAADRARAAADLQATLDTNAARRAAQQDDADARIAQQAQLRMIFAQRAASRFIRAVQSEIQYAKEAVEAVGKGFDTIVGSLRLVGETGAAGFRIAGQAASAFVSVMTREFSRLPLFGVEKGFDIAGPLLNQLTQLPGIISGAFSASAGAGAALLASFSAIFGGIGKAAASAFGVAFSGAINIAIAGMSAAVISAPFTPIVQGITIAVAVVMAALETLTRGVSGILGSLVDGFASALSAIKNGIQGIVTFAESMVTAVKDVATAALDITTQLAGIMSQNAADFIEEANKFNVAFRGLANSTNDALLDFGAAAGRSQLSLMKFAGTLQSTLVTLGFTRQEASGFSVDMTKLAVDLGSFFNVADDRAFQALESGIVGNHRALRQFGIGINQSTLGMELFAMGLGRTAKTYAGAVQLATEYEKVQARLNIIMRQSTDAQGDAARTATSFANTIKRLDALVTDLTTRFGLGLNKAIADLVEEFGTFDDVKVILEGILPIVTTLTVQLAEMALHVVKFVRTWMESGGSVEVFVIKAQIGLERIHQVILKTSFAVMIFGTVFAGLVDAAVPAFETVVAAFDYMRARGQAAFALISTTIQGAIRVTIGFASVLMAALNPVTAMMPGFADTIASALSGIMTSVGGAVVGAVQLLGGGMDDYWTASADATRAWGRVVSGVDKTSAAIHDTINFTAQAFDYLSGATDDFIPHFDNLNSAVAKAYLGMAGAFSDLTLAVETSGVAIDMLEKKSVEAAKRSRDEWIKTVNLFRSISLPNPGPDKESADSAVPAYGPYSQGLVPYYGGSTGDSPTGGSAPPEGMAYGGSVTGPGGYDRIPARLTDGEFVVNRVAAQQNRPLLTHLNAGGTPSGQGRPMRVTKIEQTFNMNFPAVRRVDPDVMEREILPTQRAVMRRQARKAK